jgi:RNA polymerase sigma-54 factor
MPPETLPGTTPDAAEAPLDARLTPEGDHSLAAETFDTGAENLYDSNSGEGGPSEARPVEVATRAGVGAGGNQSFNAPGLDLEQQPDRPKSLRAHLLGQLGLSRAEPQVLLLARLLVEELDEHGLLRAGISDLATRMGAAPGQIEAALGLVQGCEPTGVGARSLAECLALQLAERDRLDPAMRRLIENLHLLERGERRRLKALCGVDDEDFTDMLAELRALDPRPCAGFQAERAETLIPRAFVSECRANASWLVRSLDQRARTILAVATEIVRHQDRFFAEGITGLQPLTLRMVADAAGLHESTASRVTSNKYIATERGIFELKYFFSNAVGSGGPAAEAVRHRIRNMIAAEAPENVLSDDIIVEQLQDDGIDIARRTVAKYRKALGIPSSVERRRQKAMMPQP